MKRTALLLVLLGLACGGAQEGGGPEGDPGAEWDADSICDQPGLEWACEEPVEEPDE